MCLSPPCPSGAACYPRLGWAAIDIAVTSCAIILDSHSGGTRRSRRDRHTSCAVRGAKWPLFSHPWTGRFACRVTGIGLAAPALIVSPGRQSPGRFLFARTRGLLGRGTAESPSPRDHRDLHFRGDPAKKRLSTRMATPVLTIGRKRFLVILRQSRRQARFVSSPHG